MSEKKPTIVVALGGNAILAEDASAKGQKERLKQTVDYLMGMVPKWETWFCSSKRAILAKTQQCL